MKTYKHLFEMLISDENIKLALKNAFVGKKLKRTNIDRILSNQEESVARYKEMASHFHNSKHTPKVIYDGVRRKKRTIIVPSNDEQVMHHMVVNILKPIFMKSMYEHSYGSIPGRGSHKARKYISKWIIYNPKETRYCLQMDIKKFFDTVPHDILKAKLAKIIDDKQFLEILFEIIDVQEIGLPLGFYTSQWFANFYLTELDHVIKEKLQVRYYTRYMDDMIILGSNKRVLHSNRVFIEKYLNEVLGLEMKPNWQVFKIEYLDKHGNRHGRPLDYMGFKFYRNRVTLRKSILKRMRRKAYRIGKKLKPTIRDCRQFLSYIGWMNTTNVYRYYKTYIKPHVNIGYLKKRLSKYDKRRKEYLCGKEVNATLTLAY